MLIKKERITDAVLALSALQGDITGRGDLLIDNDIPAIEMITDITVPAALATWGIEYETTKCGWRIKCAAEDKDRLTDLLVRAVTIDIRKRTKDGNNKDKSCFIGEIEFSTVDEFGELPLIEPSF